MARRALRWMFREPWSAAVSGLLVTGFGVINAVRMQDRIPPWVLTGLGAFVVVGAIVARIKTGTWRRKPDKPVDARGPK